MDKKICWIIIFFTIAVNVVMLQFTIESYFGLEYEHVFKYTVIGLISSIFAIITYLYWRKLEYNENNK
ncbi:hypothetical protein [Litchfieldia salsa]|uniref:Uncharacterized protein n=1 Tax=Litchfieldia salsa TaxID=930152 RepID=A0A1H0TDM3_9BACI|nr:hypothetical protein [Litchfieldia salsa]SDP52153.1 hypothetical protein SAMN05216565_103450 [Litchfieldia salsa]